MSTRIIIALAVTGFVAFQAWMAVQPVVSALHRAAGM